MRANIMSAGFVGLASVVGMSFEVCGQCSEWEEKFPVSKPSARGNTAMAYHPSNGVVLFGGASAPPGSTVLGDTWAWDGSSWAKEAQSGPSARDGHRMVYACGEVLLFGGHDGSNRNDLWAWNGATWTVILPDDPGATDRPSPRNWYGWAHDVGRDKLVLFGGSTPGHLDDTWEWDCVTQIWTEKCKEAAQCERPSARAGHAMAYHPSNGILLFGGGAGAPNNETWAWNGTSWTKLTPPGAQPVPERFWNAMVYDSCLDRIILFGGGDANTILNDTWAWDGTRWCQICPNDPSADPAPRSRHVMAFDPDRCKTVIFGGYINAADVLDDTWEGLVSDELVCIPTVSEWGLIAMALVIVTAGTLVYMRRNPAAQ